MARPGRRSAAAAASVLVSAATGVLTNLITNKWNVSFAFALVTLVAIGAILQVAISRPEEQRRKGVTASGHGSVAIGGNASGAIHTYSAGVDEMTHSAGTDGISASAPGSVAIGGDSSAEIRTNKTDGES